MRNEARSFADSDDDEMTAFINEDLRGFIALTMTRASPEARQEFSDQISLEFAAFPLALLRAAMAKARQTISYPEKLVPFVMDHIESQVKKLADEEQILGRLIDLSYVEE